MPRRIVARVFLVCAVLLAQQTAVAHDLWHASVQAGGAQSKSPEGKKLCGLHDLLGTVLAAVSVAPAQIGLLSLSDIAFFAGTARAALERLPAPQSRGPPAVS